tara:strand:- start:1564 stop:1773 length:210 start_codon:yes stop_codon:yes gene_type:complete
MKGEFQILINGKLMTYNQFEDIPEKIGAVIKFLPDFPEEPHTKEEHEYISTFGTKLQELARRECRQLRE